MNATTGYLTVGGAHKLDPEPRAGFGIESARVGKCGEVE